MDLDVLLNGLTLEHAAQCAMGDVDGAWNSVVLIVAAGMVLVRAYYGATYGSQRISQSLKSLTKGSVTSTVPLLLRLIDEGEDGQDDTDWPVRLRCYTTI